MRILALCGLALHLTASSIWCYPNGAPLEACDGMFPIGHQVAAQTTTSPFTITLSSSTYCPSSTIEVTVSGRDFKGFLCQARTAVDKYETVGTLSGADNTFMTTNNCGGTKAALTHANSTTKSLLRLKWKPAETTPMNNVYIVCTVVVEKSTFWVKQYATLTYAGMATCTASSPCTSDYFTLASTDTCKESWMKYKATSDSTQCLHYDQFLSCIRYLALIGGKTCNVGDIHSAIAAAVMAQNKSAQLCLDNTFVDIEDRMPSTKASICNSAYVMSYILYYICKPEFEEYMDTTDPAYRCQIEDEMRLCVLARLIETAWCTNIDDVSSTFSNADLRSKNALDSTVNCDTRYGCQSFMKLKTSPFTQMCFHGMIYLLYLPSLSTLKAYNDTSSYLKCKAYEQAMDCFLVEYGAPAAAAAGCNLTQLDKDIHPHFLTSFVEAVGTLSTKPPNEPIQAFDQCKAPSFPQMPECPFEAQLVESVVINCGPTVRTVYLSGSTVNETCRVLYDCNANIEKWYVNHNICAGKIGHDIYMVKKNSDGAKYFKDVAGFDWMTCPVVDKKLGEKCYGDEECTSDANARCDTTCKCQSSYQEIGSKCVASGAVTGTGVSVVTTVLCFLVSLQF